MKEAHHQTPLAAFLRTYRPLVLFLGLAVLPFILYYPSLSYDFISTLDDDWLVVNNPAIRDLSWSGIRYIFVEDQLEMHYHPLTYLSLAIDYRLFGLDPGMMRLHNLVLHIVNGILLFLIVRNLRFGERVAFITAVLFAIHPLNMESVIWVVCRRQSLFVFWAFASILAYQKSRRAADSAKSWYALALLCWMLSMMAKVSSVVLPFLLILMDWYSDGWKAVTSKQALKRYLAFAPVLVFFISINMMANDRNFLARSFSYAPWEHVVFFLSSYSWYWVKALAAWPLAVFYGAPPEASPLPAAQFYYAAAGLLLALSGVYALLKKKRLWIFLLGFYTITIGLKLNRIAMPPADIPILVADRYFYFSALPVLLAFAWGIVHYLRDLRLQCLAALLLIGVNFGLARIQMPAWENAATLFQRTVDLYPNEEVVQKLAISYYKEGQYDKAYANLVRSDTMTTDIHINNPWGFYFELGLISWKAGDYARTDSLMSRAVELGGGREPYVLFCLGISSLMLGKAGGEAQLVKALDRAAPDYQPTLKQMILAWADSVPTPMSPEFMRILRGP